MATTELECLFSLSNAGRRFVKELKERSASLTPLDSVHHRPRIREPIQAVIHEGSLELKEGGRRQCSEACKLCCLEGLFKSHNNTEPSL